MNYEIFFDDERICTWDFHEALRWAKERNKYQTIRIDNGRQVLYIMKNSLIVPIGTWESK